jgi:FkbM family methyltransferase
MGFILLYKSGLLRLFRNFDTHYLAARLVTRGDSILDIGANVGYFSFIFASNTGPSGKVLSVEPIPVYRMVLEKNLNRFNNVKIIPYALGDKDGKVKMGIPTGDATRHGLTKVMGKGDNFVGLEWEIEIKSTEELFKNEERVDYIKCDIEGYEDRVMSGLYGIIEKFKPIIQIEVSGNNFIEINNRLKILGYKPYIARKRFLEPLFAESYVSNDIVFLTEELSLKFIKILVPTIKSNNI